MLAFSLSLLLFPPVHLASTSHKEVGERRISFGKAEESKRSFRVCPFYRYAVASGNGAADHEETARCEAAKRRRKEEKAEEYLTSQVLTVSRDADSL